MGPINPKASDPSITIPVILVFVCLTWFMGAVWFALPFWQLTGDYSWYSLSHAVTLEARAGGFAATNLGYKVHPGVPFGIASWLSLRLATISAEGSTQRIAYGIEHADEYWMWAKIMALCMNLAGFVIMGLLFGRDRKHYLIAAGTVVAALPAWYHVALFQLSIESLALVYVMGLFGLGYVSLTSVGNLQAVVDNTAVGVDRLRDLCATAVGVVTAVGCSMKIYYMAPGIGACGGIVVAGWLGSLTWARVWRSLSLCAGGFVLTLMGVVQMTLDWSVFDEWLRWNWKMLSHAGRYGTASEGFLTVSSVWGAAKDLWLSTTGTFPILVAGSCALCGLSLWRRRHDHEWFASYFPFACAVFVAIMINGLGFLKHYSPMSQHYGVIIAASLPCLVFIFAADQASGRRSTLSLWAVALAMVATLLNVASVHRGQLSNSVAIMRDLQLIQSLPLDDGERRVWAYFSPSKSGVIPLIAQYAGTRLVVEATGQARGADTVPDQYPEAARWRYLLFPKSYYPTKEAVLLRYRDMFDFQSTRYQLDEKMKFTELEAFILVEREDSSEESFPSTPRLVPSGL